MGDQADDDATVSGETLTPDEHAALEWALTTEHPVGAAIVARVRSGGHGTRVGELRQLRQEWELAGRPEPSGPRS